MSVEVAEGDTLAVGAVVARVDTDGGGGASASASTSGVGAEPALAELATSAAVATPSGRRLHASGAPSLIRFPPRLAPDGRRVSEIPASERGGGTRGGGEGWEPARPVATAAPQAPPAAPKAPASPPTAGPSSGAAVGAPSVAGGVVSMRLDRRPQGLPWSQREIDAVNCGGAE